MSVWVASLGKRRNGDWSHFHPLCLPAPVLHPVPLLLKLFFNVFLSAGPIPLRIREARVPIVNDNECVRKINTVTEKIFILPASSFCAGGVKGHDACQVRDQDILDSTKFDIYQNLCQKVQKFSQPFVLHFLSHTQVCCQALTLLMAQGDGGGPLVCEDSGYHELTGIFLN